MNRHEWELREGDGPLIATAVHAGHDLRSEVADLMALSEAERLREEDPFTDSWADIADTHVVVRRSRFEVDLNRARDGAVYLTSEQAWGLQVWRSPLPPDTVERSLHLHDDFYGMLERVLRSAERDFGGFVLYDLHSYNHRRAGPGTAAESPRVNPEINLGTGSMDRERWAGVVERFMEDLRGHDFEGRSLDVRENVRFRGGHLPRWVHRTFPATGCALAVEVAKFFMDEHTGALHPGTCKTVREALAATVPGVLEELGRR